MTTPDRESTDEAPTSHGPDCNQFALQNTTQFQADPAPSPNCLKNLWREPGGANQE
jgi:hypothetical protein